MDTRKRSAIQALLWSSYVGMSLAMIANFGQVSGSFIFSMIFMAVGLWVSTETLRALALRQGWLDRSPRALLLRLLLLPALFAIALQVLMFVVNRAGVLVGLLTFPPGMPRGVLMLMSYAVNTAVLLWLWLAVWVGVTLSLIHI